MNDKCKYCDYVSKCSRICEYNSYLCKVHRSFPKVVDKSYEQLQQENKQLKSILTDLEEWCNNGIKDELFKFDYGTKIIGTPVKIHLTSYEMVLDKIQELKEKYK